MNETCGACGKKIADGEAMTKVVDGAVFNNGEFDPQNTEHYHSSCIVIDF